ncbi:hypothetical protein HanHA300_Chr13g0498181 [Helianthus annuus]|nr:hypothetical protein HanHA300_Chr13g0498181 [Helianthus annuus]KAJ0499139.1 hypothetical protein HanHA89_Chr13g0530851 [Helianthus annuus]KAJ0665160.1 hypothetical protein HanLR1_Chr13g0500951 [Helianthus annuus]
MCVTFYITCSLTEPAAKRRGLNLVKAKIRYMGLTFISSVIWTWAGRVSWLSGRAQR